MCLPRSPSARTTAPRRFEETLLNGGVTPLRHSKRSFSVDFAVDLQFNFMLSRVERSSGHKLPKWMAFCNGAGLIFLERDFFELKNFFAVEFARFVLKINAVIGNDVGIFWCLYDERKLKLRIHFYNLGHYKMRYANA